MEFLRVDTEFLRIDAEFLRVDTEFLRIDAEFLRIVEDACREDRVKFHSGQGERSRCALTSNPRHSLQPAVPQQLGTRFWSSLYQKMNRGNVPWRG